MTARACACAQRGYDGDWLGNTFSIAVFLGNGLVAILAGLLGHGLVETLSLGPVAPFDAAAGERRPTVSRARSMLRQQHIAHAADAHQAETMCLALPQWCC